MSASVNSFVFKALLEICIHTVSFLTILYNQTRLMKVKYLLIKDMHFVGISMTQTKTYRLMPSKLFCNAQKRQTSTVIVFQTITLKSAMVNLIALLIWVNM